MALTKRAALAMAATLFLVAGCSGDDDPAAGGSTGPTTASTPTDSAPATEPNAGSPSSTPGESQPAGSVTFDPCALGATVIKAKLPGATTENDPPEPNDPPMESSCGWDGRTHGHLLLTTDEPSDFTTMKEAKARAGAGAEARALPELGRDAWFLKDGTLQVMFRTATLRVKLEAGRIEESDLLAIAKGVYADAKQVP